MKRVYFYFLRVDVNAVVRQLFNHRKLPQAADYIHTAASFMSYKLAYN